MKEDEWYVSLRIHAFCSFISLLCMYMASDCLLVLVYCYIRYNSTATVD